MVCVLCRACALSLNLGPGDPLKRKHCPQWQDADTDRELNNDLSSLVGLLLLSLTKYVCAWKKFLHTASFFFSRGDNNHCIL